MFMDLKRFFLLLDFGGKGLFLKPFIYTVITAEKISCKLKP